ncbi:MAG: FAD-dependent oxidoreductase [Verrucomicrobiales bacterium]|nr:FAD-dependent oxidoreductase [Verrucomicrobiales bacterium]
MNSAIETQLSRRIFLAASSSGIALSLCGAAESAAARKLETDVFVYGSTPGGIAAALEAARRGCHVILACPKNHAGGMTASGLCTTDAVRRELFGGLVEEFIGRVRSHYQKVFTPDSEDYKLTRDGWFYEPSIAEQVFEEMLGEQSERLTFLRGHHLLTTKTTGSRIEGITVEDPQTGKPLQLTAKTYIDGTYEGDLAGQAGVPYRVGREGRDEFGESLAGIHYMDWKKAVQIETPDSGEPSPAIQAYCARSIFTIDPEKLVPLEKPDTYEQHLPDLLPMIDEFASGKVKRRTLGTKLPRQKYQLNGSIIQQTSINCPGVSWAWPEAERHHRARLEKFHVDHAASYAWFLQNDPRVPDDVRALWKRAGLHRDEFTENDHWPWQIYVRQGRRIEGRAKLTQHSFTIDPKTGHTPRIDNPVALGEHSFDIHPCHDRRYAVEGWMEGVLWFPKKADGPAQPGQIPWGALLPENLDNLIVPVAMSSTHIAMSVLRMEPVWMTTGQIAGLAAAEAKVQSRDVAQIDPDPLPKTLGILTEPRV